MKILAFLLLSLLLTACDNQSGTEVGNNADPTRIVSIIAQDGRRHDFKVELAVTPLQQQHGLMNRTSLDKDAGMLFIFAGEGEQAFWMKNTLIPLDMLFIKRDGTIGKVHDSAIPNDLSSVHSDGPVMAVLELNGGISKEYGIKAGDKAHHPFFGNSLVQ